MAKDYYRILGLEEGADEKAVKRAYFSLVRQFSPEKEPERFQEIREAYEYLSAPQKKEEFLTAGIPDDPDAKKLYEWINDSLKKRRVKEALSLAEKAIRMFGEVEGFLFVLGQAQKMAGNTGKAVRTYEKLVERYPDQNYYRKELAIAYMDRGYGIKAQAAFRDAYEKGVRDKVFLNLYSINCRDRDEYEEGVRVLRELIRLCGDSLKDNMEYLLDAYMGIIMLSEEKDQHKIQDEFYAFTERADMYLEEYERSFIQITGGILVSQRLRWESDAGYMRKLIRRIQKGIPGGGNQKEWSFLLDMVDEMEFNEDERISPLIREVCWAFQNKHEDAQIQRYDELDLKLRMLEEWPEIQKQFRILEKDYPHYYDCVRDFELLLEQSKDIGRLRQYLLKDYSRLSRLFVESPYFDLYPQWKPAAGKMQWDSEENGAYRRTGKKIGRNDPCPCGSGKKYKNCCGKN